MGSIIVNDARYIARRIGRLVRLALRLSGIGLYKLGLSHQIVKLSPNRTRALLYHSVEHNPGSHTAGLKVNVTPETFAIQMDYVSSHYSGCSIEQLLAGEAGRCPALITFDDGYASVERNAVPVLQQRKLPATVFLIGSAVSEGNVWVNQLNYALNCHKSAVIKILPEFPTLAGLDNSDIIFRVQTTFSPAEIKQLIARLDDVLPASARQESEEPLFSSADDIIAMQSKGMYFGFHTQDHYNLRLCDETTLNHQLDKSSVAHLINSNTFAYPFGYYCPQATSKLAQQGYEQLMTVGSGTESSSSLHLGRSEVFGSTAADVFAQLEIEEPAMNSLRRVLRLCLGLFKQPGQDADERFATLPRSRPHQGLPLENEIPETSKPR